MEKLFVIWDNSNVHYGGLNQVFPVKEPGEPKELYRTNFTNLLQLVVSDRELGQVFFVGSTPPESDTIWRHLEQIGITPKTIPRSPTGEWNTTDHLLQNYLLRLGYEPYKGTIALLSGDGAGVNRGEGFFADAKRLIGVGWKIEVYSWDEICHSELRSYAEKNGKYINLSDHYYEITFLQNKRWSNAPTTLNY